MSASQLSSVPAQSGNTLANYFPGRAGATNTTGPQQMAPITTVTVDALLSNLTEENAIEFIRRYLLSPEEEFILGQVCPTIRQDITTVAWSVWEFNQQLSTPVAEQTVSSLVKVQAHKRQTALTRWGNAAQQSLDTFKTEEGRALFARKLELIASTFKKTEILDIIRSLLTCHTMTSLMLQGEYGSTEQPFRLERIFDKETSNFGVINKDVYGMDRIVEEARRSMEELGVRGVDTALMPPGSMKMYKNSEENMVNRSTWRAEGQLGVDRQENYIYANPLGNTIQGLQAVETSKFNPGEGDNWVKIDPMTRQTCIGTKTVLSGWAHRNVGQPYQGSTVYNIDTDNYQRIDLKEAFRRTRMFRDGGGGAVGAMLQSFQDVFTRIFDAAGVAVADTTFGSITVNGYGNTLTAAQKALDWADRDDWETLIDAGVPLPINIGILRPRIKFQMSSAIVMKKGSETCRNYEGFIQALVADDARTMNKIANFTMRTKATVGRKDNIRVIPDVMFQGYLGGGNFKDMFGDDLTTPATFQAAGERNVKQLEQNVAGTASAIYVALPITSGPNDFNFIDLFGNLNKNPVFRAVTSKGPGTTLYDPEKAFPTAGEYETLYGLNKLFPPNQDLDEDLTACDQTALLGVTTMFQAWQLDHLGGNKRCMIRSASHLTDELSVPGSRAIYNGQSSRMRAKPITDWDEVLRRCP